MDVTDAGGDAPDTVGIREASAELGVHYMTVYKRVRTGRLPARWNGTEWRIARSDLATPSPPPRRGRRGGVDSNTVIARLCDRIVAADEPGAWAVMEAGMASGASAEVLYQQVLVPALHRVGELWADGRLTVADEHRATAIVTRLIGRAGPLFRSRGPSRGTVILGAITGDQHALPTAIVADLLRARRFAVHDLGANVPADGFADASARVRGLVALGVVATVPADPRSVAAVIAALRRGGVTAPLVAGGPGMRDITLPEGVWRRTDNVDGVLDAINEAAASMRGGRSRSGN